MAINFIPGQVAVGDPNPGGPSALSNDKVVHVKVVKLTSANFSTGSTDTLVAVIPADSSILGFRYWNKVKLAGGSISAATLSLGATSGGSGIVSAFDVFTTVGTEGALTPVAGSMMQAAGAFLNTDYQIFARGTATTGDPTSGEIYVTIYYVR